MIHFEDYNILSINNDTTLKEVSFDRNNNEYMSTSEIKVINFDRVKEEYFEGVKVSKTEEDGGSPPESGGSTNEKDEENLPKSCDALYFGKDEIIYFIEFKNGKLKGEWNNIRIKILDSLLIFSDITEKNLKFTRSNSCFILVYNENKNQKYFVRNQVTSKSKKGILTEQIDRYKNMYFKEVYFYNEDEFEEHFVAKYS